MTKKMRVKIKNRSHRYDISRPRPRHKHKYAKYKMCLSIMMVIRIKQHLSNIWRTIHEKVTQHDAIRKAMLFFPESMYC